MPVRATLSILKARELSDKRDAKELCLVAAVLLKLIGFFLEQTAIFFLIEYSLLLDGESFPAEITRSVKNRKIMQKRRNHAEMRIGPN